MLGQAKLSHVGHIITRRGDKMKKLKQKPAPKQSFREKIAASAVEFEIPLGDALDMPSAQLTQTGVLIERHHGITKYEENEICVAARNTTVRIRGMGLQIHSMSASEIDLRGQIASVEFI